MQKKVWAAAAVALTFGSVVTGVSASAAGGSKYEVRMLSAPGSGKQMTAAAGEKRSCYTQFAPTEPDGGELAHYYRNCNGVEANVFAGYIENGVVHNASGCKIFANGDSAFWYWETTPPAGSGITISTFYC